MPATASPTLNCYRPALASAFQIVQAVVPNKTPKEILKNVKLDFTQETATLSAHDAEIGIIYDLTGVTCDTHGSVLLPAAKTNAILKEIKDADLEIKLNEKSTILKTEKSRFNLAVSDPMEFPSVPQFDPENSITLPAGKFAEMVKRVTFATDDESARFAMGGVKIEIESGSLTMIATDARRMSVVEADCNTGNFNLTDEYNLIVPSKALVTAGKACTDPDALVSISIQDHGMCFQCENATIYTRLIDGRFPRWQKALPESFEYQVDLIADSLLTVVKQSQIVTNDESRGVEFTFSNDLLNLKSFGQDVGESQIELPISMELDEPLDVTLEPSFLAEFLKVLPGETVVCTKLNRDEGAVMFQVGEQYRYIVMPFTKDR